MSKRNNYKRYHSENKIPNPKSKEFKLAILALIVAVLFFILSPLLTIIIKDITDWIYFAFIMAFILILGIWIFLVKDANRNIRLLNTIFGLLISVSFISITILFTEKFNIGFENYVWRRNIYQTPSSTEAVIPESNVAQLDVTLKPNPTHTPTLIPKPLVTIPYLTSPTAPNLELTTLDLTATAQSDTLNKIYFSDDCYSSSWTTMMNKSADENQVCWNDHELEFSKIFQGGFETNISGDSNGGKSSLFASDYPGYYNGISVDLPKMNLIISFTFTVDYEAKSDIPFQFFTGLYNKKNWKFETSEGRFIEYKIGRFKDSVDTKVYFLTNPMHSNQEKDVNEINIDSSQPINVKIYIIGDKLSFKLNNVEYPILSNLEIPKFPPQFVFGFAVRDNSLLKVKVTDFTISIPSE